MGRYNFAAQRVHQHATQLLERSRLVVPPPWYQVIGSTPPSARLTRPPLQRPRDKGKRPASRMFMPLPIRYEEDKLRWDYFNDHPWELARPRVVLENDGRDAEKWDWGLELDFSLNRPQLAEEIDDTGRSADIWDALWKQQSKRPINGESVVQRQNWLMRHESLPQIAAYDIARKEYYRIRHFREVEQRVAREEALAVGATFGPGPLEIGMMNEDKQYELWRAWAKEQSETRRQMDMRASGDVTSDESSSATSLGEGEIGEQDLAEVADALPATNRGQQAKGGAAIHI